MIKQTLNSLLGGHHCNKLLIVDLPVTVNISLADHLVNLLIGQFLAQIGHNVTELGGGNIAVSVLIEYAINVINVSEI